MTWEEYADFRERAREWDERNFADWLSIELAEDDSPDGDREAPFACNPGAGVL